ncbi:MAG TPA: cell wall-binding repeat-containing protein, partial [Candidatus Limnocylindria bacterium]|nr:cell wall-binding repeat-containing protein [Candidatus Limnocylindria bacterium]
SSQCGPPTAYRNPTWESGLPTIATSGLTFVDGEPWGDWDGQLFVSQLKEKDMRRFSLSPSGTTSTQQEIHFDGDWGRLRAATRGPAWQLYLSTSNGSNDLIVRVSVSEPSVGRIFGADRYATAAAVSEATTAQDVPVAYVASGIDFADALTGGAAAAHLDGPVLLVTPNTIPEATAAELTRLTPGRIVVLGGPKAVSATVAEGLMAYTAGSVSRLAGADRYETAARVATTSFAPGVDAAFVATGSGFADALAGVPAAAHLEGPLLLTKRIGLPAATENALDALNPARIYVLGGPAAVSDAVLASLDHLTTGPVTRLAGADRFATAAAVASLWPRSNAAYVATGAEFPDGVSGGAAAARQDVPLLLTEQN